MTRSTAGILGFATAPFVSALMCVLISPIIQFWKYPNPLSLFLGLVVYYFFSTLVTLFFALPIFLVLLRFELIRWWSTLGCGIIIGIALTFVLREPHFVSIDDVFSVSPISIGALSSLAFWLIWSQGQKPEV